MQETLPNVHDNLIEIPSLEFLEPRAPSLHKTTILLLYGSTRKRSFSRMVTQEAARVLEAFGAETKIFDPLGLPLPVDEPETHPKVTELRELMQWSEGQVWCSPERHEFRVQGADRLGSLGHWCCTPSPVYASNPVRNFSAPSG